MFKTTIEVKMPADTVAMINNCQDKRGLGMAIAKAMDHENELTLNAIKQKLSGGLLRVQSGLLRKSFEGIAGRTDAIVSESEVLSSVGSNVGIGGESVKYAAPLEFGSQPHEIWPKNKKALRFVVGGQVLIRGKVNHPGNQAYGFLRGTVDERMGNYASGIGKAALKFLAGGEAKK